MYHCCTRWFIHLVYTDTADTSPDPSLLRHKVVNHPHLNPLSPFGNNHVPRIPPLPIDNLESPDLRRGPALVQALDVRKDVLVGLAVGGPVALEEGVVADLGRVGDPLGAALDVAKQPVAVLAPVVVKRAVLGRAFEPARRRLLDVDVRGAGIVGVLLDVQGHGRQADSFACEPADALEGEGRVSAV